VARRAFLKEHERKKLFAIPVDEDSLMRHYPLSPADLLEIQLRRREHNQLGFAIQLRATPAGHYWLTRFRRKRCSTMLPSK
jgi:TnpA family transposase